MEVFVLRREEEEKETERNEREREHSSMDAFFLFLSRREPCASSFSFYACRLCPDSELHCRAKKKPIETQQRGVLGPHRVSIRKGERRAIEHFPFLSTPAFSFLPVDRVREKLGHDLGRALERDGVARGGRLEGHGEEAEEKREQR